MKPKCVTIQMKAVEQYFHEVLFIMLYIVVLTFISVDDTLVCDHSNESYSVSSIFMWSCFMWYCLLTPRIVPQKRFRINSNFIRFANHSL